MNYLQIATGVYQQCASYDMYLPEITEPVARAWARVFEKYKLTAEDLSAAVDKLYAEKQSGWKPLPADIAFAAREIRKDRADRNPTDPDGEPVVRPALDAAEADRAAQARVEAIKALAREKALERAEAESAQIASAASARAVGSNPLTVSCDWCRASVGDHCVVPGTRDRLTRTQFHDSRVEKAKRAGAA